MAMVGLKIVEMGIRARIVKHAESRGLAVRFTDMNVGWFSVTLTNVHAETTDGVKVTADLDEVEIGVSHEMSPRKVAIRGGNIAITEGSPSDPNQKEHGRGPGLDMSVSGVSVRWTSGSSAVVIENLDATKTSGGMSASATCVRFDDGPWTVSVTDVRIDRSGKMSVQAKRLTVNRPVTMEDDQANQAGGRMKSIKPFPSPPFDIMVKLDELEATGVLNGTIRARKVEISALKSADPVYSIQAEGLDAEGVAVAGFRARVSWNGKSGGISASVDRLEYGNKHIASDRVIVGPIRSTANASIEGKETRATLDITLGAVKARGHVEKKESGISVTMSVPDQECQDILDSAPNGMKDAIRMVEMSGKIGFDLRVDMSKGLDPSVQLNLRNACRVKKDPQHDLKQLFGPFETHFPGNDGETVLYRTGPGTETWTKIDLMSPFMPMAVMATEDPGFRSHHGFSVKAIENSIAMDLKEKRFSRGASTISMQLAKNLWLNRQKSVSRKFQEAVLTMYLEQNLPKEKIMEAYLNVVEFAPGVYGIRNGARHWFETDPGHLNLPQSVILALQLPNPKASPFGPDGRVRPAKMKVVRSVITGMKAAGMITEEEMREALQEDPSGGQNDHHDNQDDMDVTGWE